MDKLNKKIIKNITLPFLCFPLLFSCGNNIDSVSKVNIDMGTLIGMDEEIKNDSHMIKISYDEVNNLAKEFYPPSPFNGQFLFLLCRVAR